MTTLTSNKSRVAVAMSGGVDSSVAAGLLLEQGYAVFGITMLHYDSPCARAHAAVEDAARVCQVLGIPHHTVDLRLEFKTQVINDFIQEYLSGRTPNPCVRCNRLIKWGALLSAAQRYGADKIATGHYVNLHFDEIRGRFILSKSAFRAKDQSYALWRLTQEHLARTLFPIADRSKQDVRDAAAALGLEVAQKGESQDICFIPDDDYVRFLTENLQERGEQIEGGEIIDKEGKVLGHHKGYPFYTIGQRRNLGIALGRPIYVTEIDAAHNRIRVGDKESLYSTGLRAADTNWIAVDRPEVGLQVEAHIRYNDPGYKALITAVDDRSVAIRFDEPRASVTPGQSAVFYVGDVLLGGGIISGAI